MKRFVIMLAFLAATSSAVSTHPRRPLAQDEAFPSPERNEEGIESLRKAVQRYEDAAQRYFGPGPRHRRC